LEWHGVTPFWLLIGLQIVTAKFGCGAEYSDGLDVWQLLFFAPPILMETTAFKLLSKLSRNNVSQDNY
jgi:hypothetical protein